MSEGEKNNEIKEKRNDDKSIDQTKGRRTTRFIHTQNDTVDGWMSETEK